VITEPTLAVKSDMVDVGNEKLNILV
jgi:hypothetical protein